MRIAFVPVRLLTIVAASALVLLALCFRGDNVLTKDKENALFAPNLSATKMGALDSTPGGDTNGNGVVNPGDRLTYTVTINNTGADSATGVNLSDTIDANTTLVTGSVIASPIAVNDAYASIGNIGINVPDGANDLFANDFNPNGSGTLTITSAPTTSANGGNVSINTTTGAFTYNPAPGFEGTDTFTYTLSNGTGLTDNATVTITVSGMIWFVNSAAGAGGDGRLSSPFNCFVGTNCFDDTTLDQAGDNIFLFSGSYTGGQTLLNNQRIIGAGSSQSLAVITGITAPPFSNALPLTGGTNPSITTTAASAHAITIGQGNTIRGLTFGNTTGADIFGSGFGTLTIGPASGASDITLNGTGQALNLTNGTLAARIDSISSDAAGTGILLDATSGSLTVTGSANPATSVTNLSGIGINITDSNTGVVPTSSVNVNLGNTNVSSSAGTGVSLTNNTGTITFADLDIAPDSGQRALHALSNTGAITTTSGTISTTNATAVEISGANSGSKTPLNVQLTSVSTTGGAVATNGIFLKFTSSTASLGGFSVVGNGGTCTFASSGTCSGGRITNTSGADNTTNGIGVYLEEVANVSLTRMRIDTHSNFAIRGKRVDGFTLQSSVIDGNNGNSQAADDDGMGNGEDSVRISNLTGNALIDNSFIGGGFENIVRIVNNTGTLNRLTVTNSFIGDLDQNGSNVGQRGVDQLNGDDAFIMEARDGITAMNVTLTNNTFNNARGDVVNVLNNDLNSVNGLGTMDVVFRSNRLSNNHTNIVIAGGGATFFGVGPMTYDISCNSFRGAKGIGLNVFKGGTSIGNFSGTIFNNTIGVTGVQDSGSGDGASGINVDTQGSGTHTSLIKNNIIRNYGEAGIRLNLVDLGNAATVFNATVIGNLTAEPDPVNGFAGIFVLAGEVVQDVNGTFNLKLGGSGVEQNDFTAGDPSNAADVYLARRQGTFNLTRTPSASNTVSVVVQDNNTGTPAVTTENTINLFNTTPQLPPAVNEVCTPPAFAHEIEGENKATNNSNNFKFLTFSSFQPSLEMPVLIQPFIKQSGKANTSAEITATNGALLTEETLRSETTFETNESPKTPDANYRAFVSTFFNNASSFLSEVADRLDSLVTIKAYAKKTKEDFAKGNAIDSLSGETVSKALGTLPAGEQIVVQFKATVDANIPTDDFSVANTAQITADGGININSTTATTTVVHPPTISKAFGATNIALNGTASLTFTIGNANPATELTNVGFTDNLPAGMVVATPNGIVNNCGAGTITATAGASIITVSGLTRAANTTCTIQVNVTGTTDGVKNNTTTAVTSTQGGTGLTSNTATLNVIAAPSFTKSFGASSIPLNGSTSLTFTITNNSSAVALTNVGFTDNLPAGLIISTPPNQTGSCGGGTITADAGANSVSLSGATLAANANCTFSVSVTGTSAGVKNNSVLLSTAELGAGATANASLTVVAPPTIAKSFTPTSILVNETSTLTISISNPSDNTDALTGVGATDNFPSGLQVDATPDSTNSCSSGTFNPMAGATSVSISGVTIPAGATCTFSVKVKATSTGEKNNVTGNVTSTNGGTGGTASATLTVTNNSYEADVAPRPDGSGDGFVNVGDITQVRRFVAGLDLPYQSNEFKRVDSAPFNSLGDGFVNAGDITQVRRYAAGLDAVQTAGGPTAPSMMSNLIEEEKAEETAEETDEVIDGVDEQSDSEEDAADVDKSSGIKKAQKVIAAPRELRPTRVSLVGNVLTVAVNLNTDAADTPANAVGFTLLFDTMVLSNPTNIRLGANAPAATTITENTTQAATGRVGIVLDLPVSPAQTFPIGDAQLVLIDFTVAAMPPASTVLSFGDTPVQRFVGDINGNSLPTTFSSGNISLLTVTAASVTVGGRVVTTNGRGISKVRVTLTDQNGIVRSAMTNPFGYYRFADVSAGQVVVLTIKDKRYDITQPVIVLQVNDNLADVNFIAIASPKFD